MAMVHRGTYNMTAGREPPPRVAEALDLLCLGLSQFEIAAAMGTSVHTVRNQLDAGYKMLGVRGGKRAVVRWAQRRAGQAQPRGEMGH